MTNLSRTAAETIDSIINSMQAFEKLYKEYK